jgi:DNA repair exonuclease SbcCD ATPase subunit
MIDYQLIIDAIEKSPLSPEDKQHWKKLLPKLNEKQKEHLLHSLTAKTEITRAIVLIERALKIISQAETEAETEVKKEKTEDTEKEKLLKELEEIKKKEEEILLDEDALIKKQEETKAQISEIRDTLKQLSMDVHGQPPPSYQQPHPTPIPQLKKEK